MSQKIDLDHRRFREIVRGKIKDNLRKYISQGELIGKKGKDAVAIPVPQVEIPHFRHGSKQQGGVGEGEGDVGDTLGPGEPQPGAKRRALLGLVLLDYPRFRCSQAELARLAKVRPPEVEATCLSILDELAERVGKAVPE